VKGSEVAEPVQQAGQQPDDRGFHGRSPCVGTSIIAENPPAPTSCS
jgi:hypothetical protein